MNTNYRYNTESIGNIRISDVASKLTKTVRKGSNMVCQCPMHDDKHPSMVLYETNGQNHAWCPVCDKRLDVIEFTKQCLNTDFKGACEWLSNEFGIPTLDGKTVKPTIDGKNMKAAIKLLLSQREPAVDVKPVYSYIPRGYMLSTLSMESNFCQCLLKLFSPDTVEAVAHDYQLGMLQDSRQNEDVIFWSIDREGRVCNGKVQRYCTDLESPQFLHCDRNVLYWIGKKLLGEAAVLNNKALYGEHLLRKYPSRKVMLVESPKNAIIGACHLPDFLWLATGNSGNIKRETISVLKGRYVIVYPDKDAIAKWQTEFKKMADIAHFTVSDLCREQAPADNPKYDIADYIIDKKRKETGK